MAKTKKRTKTNYRSKNLSKKVDTKLLRDVLIFIFLVFAFYTVMYLAVYSGGSKECTVRQEIEVGCQNDLSFSTIFLLPSIILAGALQASLKRIHQIKQHIRKVQK